MPAPQTVLDLVERFNANAADYRSAEYKEAQLRQEFINPFFECLGWDMANAAGNAEAYKDVIHEDAIKIGGQTKAPDYSFRIGGVRKFFLEAKKPAVGIKSNSDPAFQLRRYAWSAKLPLSILTNFAEFAVYECKKKPGQHDKAATERVFYFNFADYGERWDEIAGIFSKTAILKGSFDRYAAAGGRRGTATVDSAFLAEIEEWREQLARNIALRNPKLSQRELNYAVQVTIDRIVFLRICEDRAVEQYGLLQDLLKHDEVYKGLLYLFQRADEKYNSGLFHFNDEEDGRYEPDTLTPQLDIDDKVLKAIIEGLYFPKSPYVFSVISADILGQVYEQFLGKVIRLTAGHQAKVEEKPEVRKAGGVYYTPTYIVRYIVEQTVGNLLGPANAVDGAVTTPKKASKLRVLDPACGSGSFLLGAYQYLLDWHRDRYIAEGPEKHKKELSKLPTGGFVLKAGEKKRILLNNIYGVDIDPQAVEVTKLSLLLKVLEGETPDSVNETRGLFHDRVLPDLDHNIRCGNSLIGGDYYDDNESLLSDEEHVLRVNAFDWKTAFPTIMKAGGFDAVIGNPPYGAYHHEQEKSYLRSQYKHQTYQLDNYLLFLERSLRDLLRPSGYYGMIIPNPWLSNLLQGNVRKYVVENFRILEIAHFQFPVFPRVTVDTEIVLLQNTEPKKWQTIVSIHSSPASLSRENSLIAATRLVHEQDKWQALDGGVINIMLSPQEEALAAKCKLAGQPLESLCDVTVGMKPYQKGKGQPPQTSAIVENRPFDSKRPLTAEYRAYLRGADISRFAINPVETRYIKYGPWLAEPRPAAKFDEAEKIVMRQTGDSVTLQPHELAFRFPAG